MQKLRIELPDNFLQEEVRCDYTVSTEMKKVWAVELDLLVVLLDVCKKHGIKIFASGGTLLGAVRHSGFIPWDDDIDMMMFREDYEKLCKVADEEFRYPYFFQTEYTDPGSLRGHAQLRNSETTAILKNEEGIVKFNQGIFIDIFPLDVVIDDEEKFEKQYHNARRYKKLAKLFSKLSTRYVPTKNNHTKRVFKHMLYLMTQGIICRFKLEERSYHKFEQECQKYNDVLTERVSTLSFQFANRQHFKYRKDFENIINLPFEFIEIPVGEDYDHALQQRYGEYKTIVKGASCHGAVIFDTESSYMKYLL